jgi:hypothetical protein
VRDGAPAGSGITGQPGPANQSLDPSISSALELAVTDALAAAGLTDVELTDVDVPGAGKVEAPSGGETGR